jgi:hypothetical protein
MPAAAVPSRRAELKLRWLAFLERMRRWQLRFRRARQILNAAPLTVQVVVLGTSALTIFAALNVVYHVVRKPTEMLFPLATALNKMPAETWSAYGALFRAHSTATVTPELLAALAQVEGAGNPVAHTYWRWRFSWNPFEIYRPASSAVGMYQMTDGTFADARHYCIHHHMLAAEGPWWDPNSCWFTFAYMRILPSHAVELTAAYLERAVGDIAARHGGAAVTQQQKQGLAAIVHLCGAGAAEAYARRGFHLRAGERCGDHDAQRYLSQVSAMQRTFARLAAGAG